ncbi:MAG: hypothetical protein MZV64_24655 [Ignavibacteriales bacterium]|nr:hypothetical protein [Ignavibacteriales bacterium]
MLLIEMNPAAGISETEYQFEDGEAKRDDDKYSYVSAWEYAGVNKWNLHKEPLEFEYVKPAIRSYK